MWHNAGRYKKRHNNAWKVRKLRKHTSDNEQNNLRKRQKDNTRIIEKLK